ncbi:hypothetical protein [Romboutsia sp. MSSM.1001216sp_RTP31141st1_G3_RTP31141_220114]|uniref:hypothetical protein n=1 Tax=unclassified Romboutsia TaxID=2626894 RepID=UPI0031B5B62F
MPIKDSVKNKLRIESGNRCAFPGCNEKLVNDTNTRFNFCHIISEKPNGPRYDANYVDYDQEENIILLCATHHADIDKNEDKYTVEVLRDMKNQHKLEVEKATDKNSQCNNIDKEILDLFFKLVKEFSVDNIIEKNDFMSTFKSSFVYDLDTFNEIIDEHICTSYNRKYASEDIMEKIYEIHYSLNNLLTEISLKCHPSQCGLNSVIFEKMDECKILNSRKLIINNIGYLEKL